MCGSAVDSKIPEFELWHRGNWGQQLECPPLLASAPWSPPPSDSLLVLLHVPVKTPMLVERHKGASNLTYFESWQRLYRGYTSENSMARTFSIGKKSVESNSEALPSALLHNNTLLFPRHASAVLYLGYRSRGKWLGINKIVNLFQRAA